MATAESGRFGAGSAALDNIQICPAASAAGTTTAEKQ